MLVSARRSAAMIAAAAILAAGLFPLFVQSPVAADPLGDEFDFSACVASQGVGSVLILMDESDTVYGTQGKPPSDPTNLRVAGAQLLMDDVQRVADATSSAIAVQFAGLGDNYVSRSNGWVEVIPGNTEPLNRLKTGVETFATRPTDENQIETDFWSGVDGARKAFDSQGACKLLVIFKDGLDFQKFDATRSSPFPIEEVEALLAEAKRKSSVFSAREAAALAAADICRPQGLADGLRGDGIYTISVGLGRGDFTELQAFTENSSQTQSCGELPGRGYLLRAEQPRDLINLFARTLNPSNLAQEFDGDFTFQMSPALSSISILSSGMTAGDLYFISPPPTCPNPQRRPFDTSVASSEGVFGAGVTWTGAGYAEGEALRVFIKRAQGADESCWSGTWRVNPGTQAKSALSIDADLLPFASFDLPELSFQPGQDLNFQILLKRASEPSERGELGLPGLTGADLHPDLVLQIRGSIFGPDGSEVFQVFDGSTITREQLGSNQTISVPSDLPLGNYLMRLTLSLQVTGLDINLSDVRSEYVINARGPIPLPTISELVVFPDLLGSAPSRVIATVSNTANKPVTLDFGQAVVVTSQSPAGSAGYRIYSSTELIEIPANSTADVELFLTPATVGEVRFAGQLSGEFFVPVTAENEVLPSGFVLSSPFKANQLPDQSLLLLIIFTLGFLVLGLLLTLLAVWLVNYRVSRFPKAKRIQANVLQSVTLPVEISQYGVEILRPLPPFESDEWQMIRPNGRRSIWAGEFELKAKSSGFRLGQIGFAEVAEAGLIGWGQSGTGTELDTRNLRPRLGLDLQQNFVVSVRPEEAASGNQTLRGQVTFISSLDSSERNEELYEYAKQLPSEWWEIFSSRIAGRTEVDPFSQASAPGAGAFDDPFNSDPFSSR